MLPAALTVQLRRLVSRLELATRQWHADVDAPWLGLVRPSVTQDDYLGVLVRTFGFVAPLESACKYTPGLERLVDMRRLTRAGLLAQDLLTLGVSPQALARAPQCFAITTFADVPEALGWLYVVERMALVQNGIRQHLQSHIRGLENACAYLEELERARDYWEGFARTLDRLSARSDITNEIVAAASAGFVCARAWTIGDRELERSTG